MGGTHAGGVQAALTNKHRYGKNFYKKIGQKGGKMSTGGGFRDNGEIGTDGLTGPERAAIAGAKGGAASRRYKVGAARWRKRQAELAEQAEAELKALAANNIHYVSLGKK